MTVANAAPKQRQRGRPFRKGMSGNLAGKRPGTRNKATRAAEALLDGEAAALTRMAIRRALEGDATALRLCLDRILPPRRHRPVQFTIPELGSASDATKVMASITTAVARGELTPADAADLCRLIEAYMKVLEATEFDQRLRVLEERQFLGRNNAP